MKDLDLLNENRSLIHTGKLFRQPEGGSASMKWNELFVLLFDNYCMFHCHEHPCVPLMNDTVVMTTRVRGQDRMTKYHLHRRVSPTLRSLPIRLMRCYQPIPLDLLTLVSFADPAIPRSGIFRHARDGSTASSTSVGGISEDGESRSSLYPLTIHHNARLGGSYILYAESSQVRAEWKQKLEEGMGLRTVVQESNKVFEVETLSVQTFNVQPISSGPPLATYSEGGQITGKVTCSIPFSQYTFTLLLDRSLTVRCSDTPDGRSLVAIGCAEGLWIGFRHDPTCEFDNDQKGSQLMFFQALRRVLHLPMVTQCTILDDFGLFLVLSDKVCKFIPMAG